MKKSKLGPLTNAEFAFANAHILRTATIAAVTMAEGMSNSDFGAMPAEMYAASIIDDLEHQIRNIKKRLSIS